MKQGDISHQSELFLMTSHQPNFPKNILTEFAIHDKRKIFEWGIGSYINRKGNVLSSSELLMDIHNRDLRRGMSLTLRAISSPLILGYFSMKAGTVNQSKKNHPFMLNFLGYHWIFVHSGRVSHGHTLIDPNEYLLYDSDSASARVFEYLRKKVIDYQPLTVKIGLVDAWATAYADLILNNDGEFNIILSNGYLSFIFLHTKSFFLLRQTRGNEELAIISTQRLTNDEEWMEWKREKYKKAKMLVFSGQSLIVNKDIT